MRCSLVGRCTSVSSRWDPALAYPIRAAQHPTLLEGLLAFHLDVLIGVVEEMFRHGPVQNMCSDALL